MLNRHYQGVRNPNHVVALPRAKLHPVHDQTVAADWVAATRDALADIGNIVSHQCFAYPDSLTRDRITAYALALIRVRECASEAGFARLTDACDALAVTVSRLIDDQGCASREKCEALTRFVAHAQTMIQIHRQSDGVSHTESGSTPFNRPANVRRSTRNSI